MQPVLEVILQNEPNLQYGLTTTGLNDNHVSVLRKMMELNKWALGQWQFALQLFGANPTENGYLSSEKLYPTSLPRVSYAYSLGY